MPTSSCIKCQTLPILNDSSSKLIIAFEVLELSKKFINYLEDENINYKKSEIANILNITPVSLSRILTNLNSKDIIKNNKKEINVLDRKSLQNLCLI